MSTQTQIAEHYTKQAELLTSADRHEFQSLAATYQYELGPRTPVERTIFAQLVLAAWNIQRTNRLQAALAAKEGVDPLLSENRTFKRIAAARAQAERTFHKCFKQLRPPQPTKVNAKSIPRNEPKYTGSSKIQECREGLLQNKPNLEDDESQ